MYEWPDENSNELEEILPRLTTEKTVFFKVKANSIRDVIIDSSWPGQKKVNYGDFYTADPGVPRWTYRDKGMYENAVTMIQHIDTNMVTEFGRKTECTMPAFIQNMGAAYHVNLNFKNFSNQHITGWEILLEETERSIVDNTNIGEAKEHETDEFDIAPTDQILPSQARMIAAMRSDDEPFQKTPPDAPMGSKDWDFYDLKDTSIFEAPGTAKHYVIKNSSRKFHYCAKSIKIFLRDIDDNTIRSVEYTEADNIIDGYAIVVADTEKLDALTNYAFSEEKERLLKQGLLAIEIFLIVAGSAIPPAAGVVIGVAMLTANLIVDESDSVNSEYLAIADDPIIFDDQYQQVHDYRDLEKELRFSSDLPEPVNNFKQGFNKLLALAQSLHIAFTRFYSALAVEDRYSANQQRDAAKDMLSLMEDELVSVSIHLHSAKAAMKELSADVDTQEIDQALDDNRSNGLPEDFIEEKVEQGYTREQLEELLSRLTAADINIEQSENFDQLRADATNVFSQAHSIYRKIIETSCMSEIDLLDELLIQGLITNAQYEERKPAANIEQNASVASVYFIDDIFKKRLEIQDVYSIQDLLNHCETDSDRSRLASNLRVEKDVVLEWANRADLMRVAGISDRSADLLEQVGVDTVVELGRRNVENLYEKISDYIDRSQWAGSVSLKNITHWVETAKKLDRKLKY